MAAKQTQQTNRTNTRENSVMSSLVVWRSSTVLVLLQFLFFSWPSLTSGPRETALSTKTPAALSPMIRSLLRLWCHESSRTYSDRLFTEEQRYWFSSLLHETVEECFCRDNTEINSDVFSLEQADETQKCMQGW